MRMLILVLIVAGAGYYWWDRDQKAKAAEAERIAAIERAEAAAAAEREKKSREVPQWMQPKEEKKPTNRSTKGPKELTNSRDIREQWGWKDRGSLDRK